MRAVRLGHTQVWPTALGFGAAPIGNLYRETDDSTARAALQAAWDHGIRHYDTAPHYGLGLSEERLGAFLAGHARADYVLSTKVGRLLVPNERPTGSDLATGGFAVPDDLRRVRDYSRDGVLRSLEASLTRLRTDRIDIAYVHDPDDHLDDAIGQAVPALVALREEAVIGAVGVGSNAVEPLRRCVREAELDAVMVAGRWTIVDRSAADLLDDCMERGVAVVSAAPFNSGLLATPQPPPEARFDYGPAPDPVRALAAALSDECERIGLTLPAAAIQFPLRHRAVVSVMCGMRTEAEVTSNVVAAGHAITLPQWDRLEKCRTSTGRRTDRCD